MADFLLRLQFRVLSLGCKDLQWLRFEFDLIYRYFWAETSFVVIFSPYFDFTNKLHAPTMVKKLIRQIFT